MGEDRAKFGYVGNFAASPACRRPVVRADPGQAPPAIKAVAARHPEGSAYLIMNELGATDQFGADESRH
jgi:hypothetical protein